MDKQLAEKLAPLRTQIDSIDKQILNLLNQRAQLAIDVGHIKHRYNADDAILKPEREAQIFRELKAMNANQVFPQKAVHSIWVEIISACRGLEKGLTVAYLGPKGSFSEQAAFEFYGHAIQTLPCPSFDEVFRAVEAGQADVGMVPVENSTEGAVNRTQDLLLQTTLKVHGEKTLAIRHCLMSKTGNMEGVERILAHPQAIAQCHQWLRRNYPDISVEPAASNSEAVRLAAENSKIAAIAGDHAAIAWQIPTIAEGIQDDANNKTRFLAIGKIENKKSGKDHTSLIVAVPNRVGALQSLIQPFSKNRVDMSRFESRPAKTGQWEYYFYIDIIGHQDDENIAQALLELEKQVSFLKILGSYPQE